MWQKSIQFDHKLFPREQVLMLTTNSSIQLMICIMLCHFVFLCISSSNKDYGVLILFLREDNGKCFCE